MVTYVTRTIVILLCANNLPCSFHQLENHISTPAYLSYVPHCGIGSEKMFPALHRDLGLPLVQN